MSLNLAVWEGRPPRDDAEALSELERRQAERDDGAPPTPAIGRFVAELLSVYPDIVDLPDDRVDEEGVWSDGPLLNNARGSYFYFGIARDFVDDVVPFVVRVAAEHGLVCVDPQSGRCLRPG